MGGRLWPEGRDILRSPYRILGVPTDASDPEIRRAYRRRARELHPDLAPPRHREARTKRFQELQEAYALLMDPVARRAYDATHPGFGRPRKRRRRDEVDEFFWNLLRSMMRR